MDLAYFLSPATAHLEKSPQC